MKYNYENWTRKKGTVPVFWNPEQYINSGWYKHGDRNLGFTTNPINYDIYGDNIGVLIPETIDPIFDKVLEFFDLHEIVCSLSKYTPGMILPWHTDNYPTYSKNKRVTDKDTIVRIIVFLHDTIPGQGLWVEDRFCEGPAGSWFAWQGAPRHMTANLSEQDRYVMQITGIIKTSS